jgi:hypothetical protein
MSIYYIVRKNPMQRNRSSLWACRKEATLCTAHSTRPAHCKLLAHPIQDTARQITNYIGCFKNSFKTLEAHIKLLSCGRHVDVPLTMSEVHSSSLHIRK